MNGAQEVLTGGALSPFNISRPAPAKTREESAAQREITLGEQERVSRGKSEAQKKAERFGREKGRKLEEAEAAKNIDLLRIEGERPLPVAMPEFQSPRKTGEELIALMLVSAVGSSAIGKKNYLAAATAMSGALKGYEAGKKTEYEQALKEFDIASKKAMQEDKINTARYLQIANSKKLTVMEKFNAIKMEALRIGDQQAAALAEVKDWDRLASNINQRLNQIDAREKSILDAEAALERQKEMRRFASAMQKPREEKLYMATGPDGKPAMVRVTVDESGVAKAPEGYTLTGEAAGGRGRGAAAAAARVPKEITQANSHRNIVIPDLEEAIPILDRLHEEKKWNTLTALLAVDPRLAEAKYKDDPEAISLIRILAKFRSSEFETAGKALTRKEDEILKPLYRADLRVYEAVRNSMTKGLREMKAQQRALEAQYPSIKEENQVIREMRESSPSVTTPSTAPAAPATEPAARKVMPGEEKLREYANQKFGGNVENARKYLKSLGYE